MLLKARTRYAGFLEILKLAVPIMAGYMSENLINVTDTVVVGRIDEQNLSAVGFGSLLYYNYVLIALGLAVGLEIIVGRRNGEKNYEAAGKTFTQGLYVFSIIATVLFVAVQASGPAFLTRLVENPETRALATDYVQIRSLGIWFVVLTVVHRMFFIGITKTLFVLYVTVGVAAVNLALNSALVFGYEGVVPAMGIKGSAWASVIAEGLGLIVSVLYTMKMKFLAPYKLYRFVPWDWELVKGILNTGFPIMLQGWVSISAWVYFFTLIENTLGTISLAASTVIKNVYILFIIPTIGIGNAVSTLVSNSIGAGNTHLVRPIIRRGMLLSIAIALVISQVFLWMPHAVMSLYTNKAGIIEAGSGALWSVVPGLILCGFGFTYFISVSGTGATRVSLLIEVITIAFYVGYMVWITRQPWNNLSYTWLCESVYFGLSGAISYFYIRSGHWKKMKV